MVAKSTPLVARSRMSNSRSELTEAEDCALPQQSPPLRTARRAGVQRDSDKLTAGSAPSTAGFCCPGVRSLSGVRMIPFTASLGHDVIVAVVAAVLAAVLAWVIGSIVSFNWDERRRLRYSRTRRAGYCCQRCLAPNPTPPLSHSWRSRGESTTRTRGGRLPGRVWGSGRTIQLPRKVQNWARIDVRCKSARPTDRIGARRNNVLGPRQTGPVSLAAASWSPARSDAWPASRSLGCHRCVRVQFGHVSWLTRRSLDGAESSVEGSDLGRCHL